MTRSLISIADVDRDEIGRLLELTDTFAEVMKRDIKKVPTLRGRTIINMFFEASTRTATSFEIAGKRLSADVINVKGSGSSVEKGETLKDTILTLDAYRPDAIVIRHKAVGACLQAARFTDAAVINAGDGTHQHPTQALLDLYTLRSRGLEFEGLNVAYVGDVMHSRVARSGAEALQKMGANVRFIAPPTLLPRGADTGLGVEVSSDISDIAWADVVYVLRMQLERMGDGGFVPSLREYSREYGVGHERLRPGQLVMHPGPMNRGVEISDRLADDPDVLISAQVESGMLVRMAVLYDLIANPQAGSKAAPRPVEVTEVAA